MNSDVSIYLRAQCLTAIVVCLLCSSSGSTAQEVSTSAGVIHVPVNLESVSVGTNQDGIASFTGAEIAGDAGSPGVPSIVCKILLPPDADPLTAQVTLEEVEIVRLPGKWTVAPYPPVATVGGAPAWPANATIKDGMNVTAYSVDEFRPTEFVGMVKSHPLRQWNILIIRLYPFQYNPVSKQLRQLRSSMVSVNFARSGATKPTTVTSSQEANRIRERVKGMVTNFADIAGTYK